MYKRQVYIIAGNKVVYKMDNVYVVRVIATIVDLQLNINKGIINIFIINKF